VVILSAREEVAQDRLLVKGQLYRIAGVWDVEIAFSPVAYVAFELSMTELFLFFARCHLSQHMADQLFLYARNYANRHAASIAHQQKVI
jgi:hypothetical protein